MTALQWHLIVDALVAIAVLALYGVWHHRVYSAGQVAGAARIQAEWDADRASVASVAAKAQAQVDALRVAAQQRNKEIDDAHVKALAAETTAAALAVELRDARARLSAGGSPVSETPIVESGSPAGAQEGVQRLDDATAAALSECTANDDELDALIAKLRGQASLIDVQ